MSFEELFRAGLLDPAAAPPAGLGDGAGKAAGKRYDVYRNNVTASLLDALRTAFPFVRSALTPSEFDRIALQYLRKHPPRDPLMMFYGDTFPDFLSRAGLAAEHAHLPDAARFDLAMRRSYHALDVATLDAKMMKSMPTEDLAGQTFPPAPATQIVKSDAPLFDLWQEAFHGGTRPTNEGAQDILITRPAFDPVANLLPQGGATWFAALADGMGFEAAYQNTLDVCPRFDLAATLTLALEDAALAAPKTRPSDDG